MRDLAADSVMELACLSLILQLGALFSLNPARNFMPPSPSFNPQNFG
jgi:hypothetical protein